MGTCLVNICMLTVPSPDDKYTLHTYDSLLGVCGQLNVHRADEELPVSCHAIQLRGAEFNYSATEWEALLSLWRFSDVTSNL